MNRQNLETRELIHDEDWSGCGLPQWANVVTAESLLSESTNMRSDIFYRLNYYRDVLEWSRAKKPSRLTASIHGGGHSCLLMNPLQTGTLCVSGSLN